MFKKKNRKTTQHKYKHQITPSNKQNTEILNMAPVYQGGCQPFSLHKPVPYQNWELHSFMSKTSLLARSSHNSHQDLKCQDILCDLQLSFGAKVERLSTAYSAVLAKIMLLDFSFMQ